MPPACYYLHVMLNALFRVDSDVITPSSSSHTLPRVYAARQSVTDVLSPSSFAVLGSVVEV